MIKWIYLPIVRYVLQYADRLGHLPWHPMTACQCLGKCVMDGYETLVCRLLFVRDVECATSVSDTVL